jgi:hypothetical protein
MVFTITSAKLTGNPGSSGWVQVYEFKPEDPEKFKLRGHLFAVIATGKQNQTEGAEQIVDSLTLGRELLSRLHEEYFGKIEGTPFNVLKSAVEKTVQEFKPSWGDIEIAAVASMEEVVYSAVAGGAQTAIFRNGMLAKILVSEKDKVVAASGYPKEEDMFILGTKTFFGSVSEGIIKSALEVKNPQSAVETLAPAVHSRKDAGNLGAVILKFSKEQIFSEQAPILAQPSENLPIKFGFMNQLKEKGKILFNSIGQKTGSFISKRLPERKIYLKKGITPEEFPEKKKTTLSVGYILLALLIVSIGFGIRQKRIKDFKRSYEGKLNEAVRQLDEAISLANLDSAKSRELFKSAKVIVTNLKDEGIKDPLIDEAYTKIQNAQGTVLGEYSVTPQLFLDLSLISSGFVADNLVASGDKFFVLDKNGKRIVGVTFSTKKTEMVAGPDQIDSPKAISTYEDRVFINTDQGIIEVGDKKKEVIAKDWTGEVIANAYAGNFYVLEKDGRMINRYVGSGDIFATKQKWLGPGVSPNFAGVISMTIDGSIWVLNSNASILRYIQGSPKSVPIIELEPAFNSANAIYTNENLQYVYLLDKGNQRIVVINKDGVYKAQYFSDKLAGATDLVVDESQKKIIISSGSNLYSIELMHL